MTFLNYPKNPPSSTNLQSRRIQISPSLSITLERTVRIPQDGKVYPLPPSLGQFPIKRVQDYADKVPESWREHGGVFFPMYQREAMWINFHATEPSALQIAVGKVNAINGKEWSEHLQKDGYVVAPRQPWLDGIKGGDGQIKQFVAMPLGMGYTVESQVTGVEEFGGIQIKAFDLKQRNLQEWRKQRFQTGRSRMSKSFAASAMAVYSKAESLHDIGAEMGMAAGGQMEQQIFADEFGLDAWDTDSGTRVYIHIVNSQMYKQITGEDAPTTPIDAQTYSQHGYPWYAFYDESLQDTKTPEVFENIKSVHDLDKEKGINPNSTDGQTVSIPGHQVKDIKSSYPKLKPDSVQSSPPSIEPIKAIKWQKDTPSKPVEQRFSQDSKTIKDGDW